MEKITVTINGKQRSITAPCNVGSCLDELGLSGRQHLAVAVNGLVVERAQFASTAIRETDKIEIVRPVGGG